MSDKVFLGPALADLDIGEKTTRISRVNLLVDGQTMYTAGDNTGRTIEKSVPWASQSMANDLLSSLSGYEYRAFSGTDALIDPSAEIGDGITVGGIYSVLAQKSTEYGRMSTSSIAAPESDEIDDEYPYISKKQREDNRKLAQTYSYIKKTAEQIKIGVANDMQEMRSEINVQIDSITLSVDKELEGLHSEIEQTASSLTSTIANTRSGLESQIKQTESSLSTSISDTKKGLESTISQTASGLQTQISSNSGDISTLKQTTTSLESSLKSATGDISTLKQTTTSLQSSITNLNGSVSSINQTISNISLSVSGSLGGTASISLSAGGKTSSGSVDLSKVRSAFANDNSTVTISAGKITFNSGTFVLNSGNISIDEKGNLTSENGTIKGATISGGSVTTEYQSVKSILQNGVLRCYRNNKFIGKIGAALWDRAGSVTGLDIGLGSEGKFLSISKFSIDYDYEDVATPIIVYSGNDVYYNKSSSEAYLLPSDTLNFFCNICPHGKIEFVRRWGGVDYKDGHIGTTDTANFAHINLVSNYGMLISSVYTHIYGDVINGYIHIRAKRVMLDGTVMMNNSVVSDSDVRLKTNIKESNIDALGILNGINLYSFDWALTGEHRELGFISQQIGAESSSDLIHYSETDDTYRIRDLAFIPYIVRAIQQLYSMISPSTPKTINSLKKKWTPDMYTEEETREYLERVVLSEKEREQGGF